MNQDPALHNYFRRPPLIRHKLPSTIGAAFAKRADAVSRESKSEHTLCRNLSRHPSAVAGVRQKAAPYLLLLARSCIEAELYRLIRPLQCQGPAPLASPVIASVSNVAAVSAGTAMSVLPGSRFALCSSARPGCCRTSAVSEAMQVGRSRKSRFHRFLDTQP